MKYGFVVVGSLLFVAAGCGTSSKAEEKVLSGSDTILQDKMDKNVSILIAVLAEDAEIIKNESSGRDYARVILKDMVKLQGEFDPGALFIPNLDFHQINGDHTALKEGTKIRLVTGLLPPTTRSFPPQLVGNSLKEFTILD
ncbi:MULTISPECIES: hypothetical protein [unclassified Enterococcus]|uniref:hypothetical protein n=1 Tax=unclassified Enterococcus TaxID=2608891 RepID=UPI003D2E564F